ncbi:MAG: putative transporter permease protein [Oscillospiraceae bacterium]|nr:putative transporter permease protein [Oscillospiraceae bacterium]
MAQEKLMILRKKNNISNPANTVSRKTAAAQRSKKNKWYKISSLIGFFAVWQFISYLNVSNNWFNPVFLPSPSMIIETGYTYIVRGTLVTHLTDSFVRMFSGFAIGVLVSVIIGMLITSWKWFDNMVMPVINLIGPIPVLAFLPMFLIWFGIGEGSKIALIAYATFIPMLGYVVEGIRNTDPYLIRSAISLGATKFQVFRKITFNSALPNIFVGMKASLAFTFSALVVAEMMGASTGLGFIIVDSKNWFKMSDMFMAATLIGLEYTIFHGILTLIENVILKWKREGVSSAVEE